MESTSLIKQEATESLLITQLVSCSLVCMLFDPCSLFTRVTAVVHGSCTAFDRVASKECTFERVLFREIWLKARLLCCRLVSVRVGVMLSKYHVIKQSYKRVSETTAHSSFFLFSSTISMLSTNTSLSTSSPFFPPLPSFASTIIS